MTILDTSALVATLSSPRPALAAFERLALAENRIAIPAIVLFEWKRGPRTAIDLQLQEEALPSASALPFGPAEADIAAGIYRQLKRSRGREMDIAIAATAIAHGARLWTLNPKDFADIPGLKLARP